MRSSDRSLRVSTAVGALFISVALASCAPVTPKVEQAETKELVNSPCSLPATDVTAKPDPAARVFFRQAEASPLFAAAIGAASQARCEPSGSDRSFVAAYTARNGNTLRVARDERIEYSDQEARFVVPPGEPPLLLLQRAERAGFGAAGCGIDWTRPEVSAGEGPVGEATTVYRGDVCNCQARIQRNASGVVVVLGLRSTC